MQMDVLVRNAMLDAIETAIGTSAVFRLRTGSEPAGIEDASSGTVVSTHNAGSDWMSAAAAGAKALAANIEDSSADNAGTIGHYEVLDSGLTNVFLRGPASESGGGGELILDNAVVTAGQTVTITGFDLTAGNAG